MIKKIKIWFADLKEKARIAADPNQIVTNETRWCPFCMCDDIYSGSWTPECCQECGATYFFGSWFKEEPKRIDK